MLSTAFDINPKIVKTIKEGRAPIVSLESTIITHGLSIFQPRISKF